MSDMPDPGTAAECTCGFLCSDQPGCIACWVHGAGCVWQCYDSSGGDVYHPAVIVQADEKVELDRRVNLQMHNASLGKAGKVLAEVAEAKIFVPGDRIDERRDLYLEDVPLEEVIRELGLMAQVRP